MLNIFASLKVYAGKWTPKQNMVDENGHPVPNPRNLSAEEIATIALFLATDASSFINGQSIVADSGWTAF